MTRVLFWTAMIVLLALLLTGCHTITSFLPPQPCKPAVDLPAEKHLAKLPEVDTPNDVFYGLLLTERSVHAKDDQDYNSLYSSCVKLEAVK